MSFRELVFRPINAAQQEFVNSTDKVVAYIGGIGSGKTHVGGVWALTQVFTYPKGTGLIAANSYKQLESATLIKVFDLLDEMGLKKDRDFIYNQQTKQLRFKMPGYSGVIHCRSLTEFNDLRGIEFLWAWMDETRDTVKEAFEVVLGRMRQRIARVDQKIIMKNETIIVKAGYPIPASIPPQVKLDLAPSQVRITTTPDMMRAKWLYDYLNNPDMKRELAAKGVVIKEIHSDSRENPYLPLDYLETVAASYDDEMKKQEIAGEWVLIPPGKPVFVNNFSGHLHISDLQFNRYRPLLIGIDWGYHHPAAVFLQEDQNERLCIIGEMLGENQTADEFCLSVTNYINQRLLTNEKLTYDQIEIAIYCDPAGNSKSDKSDRTSVQMARDVFGPKIPIISKKSSILDGITIIRQKMNRIIAGKPALLVDRTNCTKLIEAFRGGYHYPEQTDEFAAEKPLPFKDGYYDHLVDALRYACINRYHVTTGDYMAAISKQQRTYDIADAETGY